MAHIVSKNSKSHSYRIYDENGRTAKFILVNGGSGITDRKTLIAPSGVITNISDSDLELLKKSDEFQRHQKGGLVTIISNKNDKEKASKDLKENGKSSQLDEKELQSLSNAKQVKE